MKKDIEKEIEEYRRKKRRLYDKLHKKERAEATQRWREKNIERYREYKKLYQREYRKKHQGENREEENRKLRERRKRLRIARSYMGVCTECGKEDERTIAGNKMCCDCIIKFRKKNGYNMDKPLIPQKKEVYGFKRSERVAYGLCYICGKPQKEGFKLCPECYDIHSKRLVKARAIAHKRRKEHPWRQQNDLQKAKNE